MFLLGKKDKPKVDERLLKELAYSVLKAKGTDRDVTQFANAMRLTDPTPIVDILKRKIVELPDRKLLRRIADNSFGRITFRLLYDICGYHEFDKEEDCSYKNFIPKRSQIYTVDLGMYRCGCEQQGKRPFLVISNDKGNKYGNIIVGLPLTTKCKNTMLHIPIGKEFGLAEKSYAMVEQIISIDKSRFCFNGGIPYKIATLPEFKMKEVQQKLEFELGFESLMFDEGKAFELIRHIKLLQNMNNKKSSNFIEIINEKMGELIDYCGKHGKNLKIVMQEYDKINDYVCNAM